MTRPDATNLEVSHEDHGPILIGGEPGSGAGLLAKMLGARLEVAIVDDPGFMTPPDLGPGVLRVVDRLSASSPFGRLAAAFRGRTDRATVEFCRRFIELGLAPEEIATAVREVLATTDGELVDLEHRCLLVGSLCDRIRNRRRATRWGLELSREIGRLECLRAAWPQARIVHVIRDGRDVAAERLARLNASAGIDVTRIARDWSELVAASGPDRESEWFCVIRYEELVQGPEDTMHRLMRFLGMTGANHPPDPEPPGPRAAADMPASSPEGDVGRHRRELPVPALACFEKTAAQGLETLGYLDREDRLAVIDMGMDRDDCVGNASCERMTRVATTNLAEKYLGHAGRFPGQVRSAIIDLRDLDYDDYQRRVRKLSKGSALRQAAKSDRAGMRCHRFARRLHLPDIVEINHSKSHRSGGAMRSAYLKTLEEMGGPPTKMERPEEPVCSRHHDTWWGVFQPTPGYRQGEIVTDEKLLAYVDLRRLGSFAFYSLILGHGAFLHLGIMYRLHFAIMQWLCDRAVPATRGIDYLMYSGMDFGGDGMMQWKRKTGFQPARLVLQAPPAFTRTDES